MQATLVSYGNLNDLPSGGETRKSFARLRGSGPVKDMIESLGVVLFHCAPPDEPRAAAFQTKSFPRPSGADAPGSVY